MTRGLAFSCVYVLVLTACGERPAVTKVSDDPFLSAPSQMATNIVVTFSDSSFVKARLYASVGRILEQEQQTTMSGPVTVDFFDRQNSDPVARMTSDSCLVEDRTKNMTAIGNVVVTSLRRDIVLHTSKLSWVQSTQRIRSDEAVTIETPQERIDGVGFESNQDLTSYRLLRVRGVQRK
ncbi:MAG: LPS export ABC transporter periplasmic protein LptC [Candidatus Kapabacteria bacterium]|nr:LPS export ABC transporter periplasmic protein LptC [Candidatus Kapabacteria bacterium]